MSQRISSLFVNFLFVCIFFTEIGFYSNNNLLISISNNASFMIVIVIVMLMFRNIKKKNLLKILITLFIVSFVYILKYYTQNSVNIRELIFIIVVMLTLAMVPEVNINILKLKHLRIVLYVLTLVILYASFNSFSYSIYYENYLTLGYSNPNVLASVLLTHIIYISVLSLKEGYKNKILSILFIFVNLYLLNLTHSRTALFAGILMFFMFLFNKIFSKGVIKVLGYFSIVLPLFITFFSQGLNTVMNKLNLFSKFGKPESLNGREEVWQNQLNYLYSNTSYNFLGIDESIMTGIPSNSHNYMLFIFYHHGFIILLNYFTLLFIAIKEKIKKISSINIISLFGWFIVTVENTFESYLSTGLIVFSISWLLLLSNFHASLSDVYRGDNSEKN